MIVQLLRIFVPLKPLLATLALGGFLGVHSSCNLGPALEVPAGNENPPSNEGVVTGNDFSPAPETESQPSAGSGTILAFGDSITEGTYGESWGYKLSRMTGRKVVVSGKGNTTAVGSVGRLSSAMAQSRPSTVCILYGTVDCRNGISANATAGSLAQMVAIARAKGANVVVGTVPPQIGSAAKYAGAVAAANRAIPGAVQARGARVANVYGSMAGRANLLHRDGFHPEDAGQAVIAAAFADNL